MSEHENCQPVMRRNALLILLNSSDRVSRTCSGKVYGRAAWYKPPPDQSLLKQRGQRCEKVTNTFFWEESSMQKGPKRKKKHFVYFVSMCAMIEPMSEHENCQPVMRNASLTFTDLLRSS